MNKGKIIGLVIVSALAYLFYIGSDHDTKTYEDLVEDNNREYNRMLETNNNNNQDSSSNISDDQEEENKVLDPEEQKSHASEVDAKIYEIFLKSKENTELLKQEADNVVNKGSLQLYNLARDVAYDQSDLRSELFNLNDDINYAYVGAARDYSSNTTRAAHNIMDFIDEEKMEYMSDATRNLEESDTLALDVISARKTYLSDNGFTDEEIAEIIGTEK